MSRIKLITFDVMNTILRTKVSIGEEYAKMAQRNGLQLDGHRITQEFPKVFKGLWEVQPNFGASRGILAKEWWTSAVLATFERSGLDLSDSKNFDNTTATAEMLFEHYGTSAPWTLTGSYDDLLSRLRKNRTLGIISNFDERLEPLLSQLGIRHLFDFVIASQTVKIAKPFPAIFDLALGKAQLADGSNALHVGDNIRLDYKAAKEAGWNAVWLCSDPATRKEYPVDESEEISDLGQLANLRLLQA